MILVNSLRYHLFSLLQRHKENAKTFNPPLLFLRVWRLEEIQTLPFPREIFLPLCPQDTIPSQACIFDLLVLHSPGRVTGLLASRNSTMLMGTGTVTRVSQSYPLKHIGRLITRDRKAARAKQCSFFLPLLLLSPQQYYMYFIVHQRMISCGSHSRDSLRNLCMAVPSFFERGWKEKSLFCFFSRHYVSQSQFQSLWFHGLSIAKSSRGGCFFQKYFPPWNDFQKVKFMVHVLFNFRYGN